MGTLSRRLLRACLVGSLLIASRPCYAQSDRLALARESLAKGDYKTAIDITTILLKENSEDIAAAQLNGRACFTAAEQLRKSGSAARDWLAAYRAAREALTLVRNFRGEQHTDGSTFQAIGWCYLVEGDYQQAAQVFEAAITRGGQETNFAAIHRLLGLTFVRLDQTDVALRQYRRALELDPREVDATLELSELLAQQMQQDEARKLLWSCVSQLGASGETGDLERVYLRLYRLALSENNLELALEPLRLCRTAVPNSLSARFQLGYIYYRLGEFAGAQGEFAIFLEPGYRGPKQLCGEAHAWSGIMAAHQDDFPRARALLTRALEIIPNHGASLQCLARTQKRLGESELAATTLEKFRVVAGAENRLHLLRKNLGQPSLERDSRIAMIRELIGLDRLDQAAEELLVFNSRAPNGVIAAKLEQEIATARAAKRP
ncbi:MAG: tetratricopeptide repeat protein [Planctomycetota bacterium]